ncbi:MAG: hypothetical protein HOK86_02850, partial [Micrococcales bacterium]|nr:hypothetical protein [Micrococcales bacterium]
EIPTGIGFGVMQVGVLGLVTLVAIKMLALTGHRLSLIQLAVFGLFIGSVRGVLMVIFDGLFGLVDPVDMATRVLSSALFTGFWFSAATYLVHEGVAFNRKYKALRNQVAAGSDKNIDPLSPVTPNQLAMDDLTRVLQSLGKLVSGQDATAENLRMAAEAVRTKSDQVVRPLSHKIWMDSKVSAPKARLSEVSKQAIIDLDYSLGRVLAIEAMFFLGLVSVYSIERVLLASLALPLVALFSIAFRPKNQDRAPSRAALINFVFLVAIATIPIFVDDLLVQFAGFNSALFPVNLFTLIAPLWLGVIIVFDSSLTVLRKSRVALVEELEKQKASAPETGDEDLAGFLHNSLQSELTVLSLQLQAASESQNPTDAKAAWEQLGAWINKSVSEDFENSTLDPASRAFGSIAAWRGIADVEINISPETFSRHSMAPLLVQVIEESISNSVRHLKATKITFHFAPSNTDQLIIETNGRLPAAPTNGIGTSWLNSISLKPTELVETATGTRSVIDL